MTDYIAGIFGGIAVVLVGHPFDTCKTRMQVAPEGYYKNTIDCVRRTFKSKGILGFYSGMAPPLYGQMIFRSAAFGTYFHSVNYLSNGNISSLASTQLLQAGAITGFVISFIETPIDLIKTKLQINIFSSSSTGADITIKNQNVKIIQCVGNIVKSNGIFALWQGWSATAIRNIPANALFFPVNEIVKRRLAEQSGIDVKELHSWQRLTAGASAGLSYWILTYPLDLIKSQMMASSYESRGTWLSTARSVYAVHGWRGFSRGIGPCAARAIPACAVMFSTVDYVRLYINHMFGQDVHRFVAEDNKKIVDNSINKCVLPQQVTEAT